MARINAEVGQAMAVVERNSQDTGVFTDEMREEVEAWPNYPD